jgi:CDP-diacylglycerol--glycerol-3-phosphate 3-phosphatidyltransferase
VAESRLNVPNGLSALRIACVPVLLLLAWRGAVAPFVIVFGLGLATDVLDGVLARRLGQVTDFGARLDQWGDFALWLSLPLAAWWLWPEIIVREAPYVALALVCMLLPTAIAYAKYRAVPGYHTWSVKLGSVAMGISVPLLLLFDFAWPFRVAALWQVVCAIDELAITWQLTECHNDVSTAFHAIRIRRGAR